MSTDIISFLKEVSLFSGLPEQALRKLGARELLFAPQDTIVREGEPAGDLYIIASGSVDIVKRHGRPDRQVIAARGAGDLIGEMGLCGEQRRYATVVAREPVTAIAIPYQTFLNVVEADSAAMHAMYKIVMQLVGKLRQAQDARLAAALRDLDDTRQSSAGFLAFMMACLRRLQSHVDDLVGATDSVRLDGDLLATAPPELHERLGVSWEAADRVRRDMEATTDFADLVSSQGRLVRRQVNFADLARQAVAALQGQAAEAGVTVELEIAAEPMLSGDGAKLTEAMRCLLRSAIESNAGGLVLVWVLQRENAAYYEVEDTGGKTPVGRFDSWDWTRATEALVRGGEIEIDAILAQYAIRLHGGDVWGRREEDGGVSLGFWVPTRTEEYDDDAEWF